MDKIENFLIELSELTQKYGIAISGEGCDKPFLDDVIEGIELGYDLEYNYETKKYKITQ